MTLEPSRKKNKKQKNNNRKQKQRKNTKIPKTKLFSYQSIASFLVGVQNFLFFDNLAQKTRTQKHYKNRGFNKACF